MSTKTRPPRIRTALLSQEPYRIRLRQVLAADLAKLPNWELLPLDELYPFLQLTLTNAALKVLGNTLSRAKPTMTDEIRGLLDIAKQLYQEASQLPPGTERNQAKIKT